MKFRPILFVAFSLLFLSACNIIIDLSTPFDTAPEVTLSQSFGDGPVSPTPVTSGVVRQGTPAYFQVPVDASVSDDLLYVEADAGSTPVMVELFTTKQFSALASVDPTYFSSPSLVTLGQVASASITTGSLCIGPCVITTNDQSRYFVKVSTSSATDASFDLFLYSTNYREAAEPSNDSCSSAAVVGAGNSYVGALETLGDLDCLESGAAVSNVSLIFQGSSADIEVQAIVQDASDGTVLATLTVDATTTQDSLTITPAAALRVQVRSANDTAGTTDGSQYRLDF